MNRIALVIVVAALVASLAMDAYQTDVIARVVQAMQAFGAGLEESFDPEAEYWEDMGTELPTDYMP